MERTITAMKKRPPETAAAWLQKISPPRPPLAIGFHHALKSPLPAGRCSIKLFP
jgi:hypothetical protein